MSALRLANEVLLNLAGLCDLYTLLRPLPMTLDTRPWVLASILKKGY